MPPDPPGVRALRAHLPRRRTMIRRFAVGAVRAAACAQTAPYTSGNVQGAGKVYAIACSGVRSAAARYAGFHAQATLREKEFKNVDYSPDLKETDFDGPVDLDRPQNRTVGSPRVQALADDIGVRTAPTSPLILANRA